MKDVKSSGSTRRRFSWLVLVVAGASIFVRVAIFAHSVATGLAAVACCCGLVVGLVVWSRRRADSQIASSAETGHLKVELGIHFSCLPGEWPERARETLNPASYRSAVLPVILTASDRRLILEKQRSLWVGRSPFRAEISTTALASVRVGPSTAGITGSTITIELVTGERLLCDTSLPVARAEILAAQVRPLIPSSPIAPNGSAIEIVSPPPPVRTPPSRAGLLMMAGAPPFFVAVGRRTARTDCLNRVHAGSVLRTLAHVAAPTQHAVQDDCGSCRHSGSLRHRRHGNSRAGTSDRGGALRRTRVVGSAVESRTKAGRTFSMNGRGGGGLAVCRHLPMDLPMDGREIA